MDKGTTILHQDEHCGLLYPNGSKYYYGIKVLAQQMTHVVGLLQISGLCAESDLYHQCGRGLSSPVP